MDEFEKWLRTVCFQNPTKEAYDLAKAAWAHRSAEPVSRSAWQHIETAPKDGTEVLLFLPNDEPKHAVGYFSYDEVGGAFWTYSEGLVRDVADIAEPTHWMPLPEAPKVDA